MVHQSALSYNIQRPYPYRWTTPTVVIGAVVATIVFSLLNFSSSGYNLEVEVTADPNATMSKDWFGGLPSIVGNSKVQATCQPSDVQLNSPWRTNNSALDYILTEVKQGDNIQSSLVYNNQYLESCRINEILLSLQKAGRTPAQMALAAWGVTAQSRVACSISQDSGSVLINLTATYNLVPDTVSVLSGFFTFSGRNETQLNSLYWAESLLANSWTNLSHVMEDQQSTYSSGLVSFKRSNRTSDVTSLDYYWALQRTIVEQDDHGFGVKYNDEGQTVKDLIDTDAQPNIWAAADTMAKVMEATVMTDLGQGVEQDGFTNMLTNPSLLTLFTKNISYVCLESLPNREDCFIPTPGLTNTTFTGNKKDSAALGVTPSTIATTYICQVPKRKRSGDLVTSILIADLVFLQALWLLFKLVVGWIQSREDPRVNYCDGCLKKDTDAYEDEVDIPLRSITPADE